MTAPPLVTARRRTLRAIALFEAAKGLAALAAVIGLLDVLRYYNLHHLALALLWRFHLNTQTHYPALLLHYADLLSVINVRTLAPLAIGYISLRLLESYGLWKEKTWAEWLGALSRALYLPLEAGHLMHRTSLINGAVLLANLAVVGFLALQLWQRRNIKKCEVCR